ncbi:PAQR family membrane homeostasis protein TrhA [Rhodoferax fermentans]|uniref:Hemolysin D n=1 Tax=Rhodoferax fermentans TaxID=28066 RepID=A0A1T1AN30_RHOFE|nr:hemolysin III family protein [Rhodoferax fermentans]MBK1684530.1 hemolysin D [Rhodoferax fermentans]OOV05551.1 hemolysin D [Rhodoferax fermentans]
MAGMTKRPQTLGEEIANSVSHGVALLAALLSMPFLLASAGQQSAASFVGTLVFAITMVLLYLASTLYHAMPEGRAKQVFCKLDHGAIYLFIAGTYTPFALGALNGAWGWSLFTVVWVLAAIGITLKALNCLTHPWWSTGLYLAMGWLVVVAAVPLLERVPMPGILWLVAGGLAYTVGVIFFVLDSRIRYSHAVWHGFVVTGTACHFVAVQNFST